MILRQDYLTLFNLQRYVARKEQDTLQLRQDLQAVQKSSANKAKKRPASKTTPASKAPAPASKAPASRPTPAPVETATVAPMVIDHGVQ